MADSNSLLSLATDGIFRPLSGKYRKAYAQILDRLNSGLFSLDETDQPTRQVVMRDVTDCLDAHKATLSDQESAEFRLTPLEAYNELLTTGWLSEQREGWAIYVEIEPRAAKLLDALCSPDDTKETFGGTMISVLSSLEAARNDPDVASLGVAEAARRAKAFARYVRGVVGSLKTIEKEMLTQASLNGLVHAFFNDFVERIVIRDYRTLTLAKNHPYSFKWRIQELVEDVSSDSGMMDRMANCLVKQGAAIDAQTALSSLAKEFRDISSALDSIESFRYRIDITKTNIERRFTNTLRYMNSLGSGGVERFSKALAKLGATHSGKNWKGDEDIGLQTWLVEPPHPIDSNLAVTPTAQRTPVEIQRFRQPIPDPLRVAFDRAKAEFDRMLTITPQRFMDYVNHKLKHKPFMTASDIAPTDLEELVIFSALRASPPGRVHLPDGVVMIRGGELIENEWVICGDFVLKHEVRLQEQEVLLPKRGKARAG